MGIAVLGQESLAQSNTYPGCNTASQVVAVTALTTGGQSHDCGDPSKITVALTAAHLPKCTWRWMPVGLEWRTLCQQMRVQHVHPQPSPTPWEACLSLCRSTPVGVWLLLNSTYRETSIAPEGKSILLPSWVWLPCHHPIRIACLDQSLSSI